MGSTYYGDSRLTRSRSWKTVAILLVLSALLGIEILVEEALIGPEGGRYLWEFADVAAPVSHAYALIAFVIIDFILIILIFATRKRGVQIAFAWGILQVLAMLLNPVTAPQLQPDYTPLEFAEYLFSIWAYDALLVVRIVMVPIAWRASRTTSPH